MAEDELLGCVEALGAHLAGRDLIEQAIVVILVLVVPFIAELALLINHPVLSFAAASARLQLLLRQAHRAICILITDLGLLPEIILRPLVPPRVAFSISE